MRSYNLWWILRRILKIINTVYGQLILTSNVMTAEKIFTPQFYKENFEYVD